MLRRELKGFVRGNGNLSLLDVRSEAVRWVKEGQPHRDRGIRVLVFTNESQLAVRCEAAFIQPRSELAELKDLVLK